MKKISVLFANGFGLGFSPFASGTVGSLPGIPLAYLVHACPSLTGQILFCALLVAFAVYVCDVAEKEYGKKDDGRIVADEYMLLPICTLGVPMYLDLPKQLAVWGLVFVLARVFDIVKPPPARGLQSVKGGVGIVIDDLFASFYALAAIQGALYLARQSGWL